MPFLGPRKPQPFCRPWKNPLKSGKGSMLPRPWKLSRENPAPRMGPVIDPKYRKWAPSSDQKDTKAECFRLFLARAPKLFWFSYPMLSPIDLGLVNFTGKFT